MEIFSEIIREEVPFSFAKSINFFYPKKRHFENIV